MNRFSSFMSSLRPSIKAIVITVMTLLFSHIAIYDLTSVSFFSPMEKAADFRFSDFYTLVADSRPVSNYEKDIVIVPLDDCDRRQMAEAISSVDFCAPAAVGLDIFFPTPSNADEDPLADALADCDNLVMPVFVKSDSTGLRISHESCYDDLVVPSGEFAAANIQGSEKNLDNVRDFRKGIQTEDGYINTLAAALVSISHKDAYSALEARKNETEEIFYASREFEIVAPNDILDNKDLIEGRVVLLGKLNDRADQHITPLQNRTPGLMIHAYILATIINGDYIRQLSEWEDILLGSLMCLLVVWINLHLMTSVMGPLLVRSLQIGLLYFLILTGTQAYIRLHVDLNFSYSMLTVTLGVAACEVYGAIFDRKGLIDFIYINYNKLLRKYKSKRYEKKKVNANNETPVDHGGDDCEHRASCRSSDIQDKGRRDTEVRHIKP